MENWKNIKRNRIIITYSLTIYFYIIDIFPCHISYAYFIVKVKVVVKGILYIHFSTPLLYTVH